MYQVLGFRRISAYRMTRAPRDLIIGIWSGTAPNTRLHVAQRAKDGSVGS
jgi:hypothetical protein